MRTQQQKQNKKNQFYVNGFVLTKVLGFYFTAYYIEWNPRSLSRDA